MRKHGKGSWKMQYQTAEMKTYIRDISNKIFRASTSIQNIVDLYVKTNIEIEKVKNGNSISKVATASYAKVRNQSMEFMMKKIDNQILNCLKKVKQDNIYRIRVEKNKEYTEKMKEIQLEKVINNRLQMLFYNINQDLNIENNMQQGYKKRTHFLNQTKRARREEALKNRDIGLINWQEK